MDIDLNTTLSANRIAAAGFAGVQDIAAEKSDQLKGGGIFGPALTVTERQMTGLEALDELGEADLRRDDPLGKLVLSAFDFKAPDAPDFI